MAIGPAAGAAESFEALRSRSENAISTTPNDETPSSEASSSETIERSQSTDLSSGTVVNTTA